MKFVRARRSGRGFAVVEITPLIDVVFLLLIFLVVSTTFVRTSAIEVDLPDSSGDVEVTGGIEVRVAATGDYAVNEQALAGGGRDLLDALRRVRDEVADERPLLVIAADADARHEAVVHVLDAARELGLTNVRVLTEAPSPAPDDETTDG